MATSWQQSIGANTRLQTHQGYTTSLDITRRQTFNTNTIAGVKRSVDGAQVPASITRLNHGEAWSLPPPAKASFSIPPNRYQASAITDASTSTPLPNGAFQPRSTPGASQHPLLSLAHPHYGLPEQLVSNFRSLGVQSIYPWQSSCLLQSRLLEGQRNFIYTAPTGGGKSLVADVLMLKRIIASPSKKAILVLPYVALVQEKIRWLRRVVEDVEKDVDVETYTKPLPGPRAQSAASRSIRVAGFYGGVKGKLGWSDCDIAVCTIEKANALINEAIEEGRVGELGVIVLDELHMLDDEQRGYIMELMITKLLFLRSGVQIVGMSATLPNPQTLAEWMQAKFYISKYRPIPIEEYLVYDNCIYPTASSKEFFHTASQLKDDSPTQKPPNPSHTIATSLHKEFSNPVTNAVVALAVSTGAAGYGSLVFCASRHGVQTMAVLISATMPTDAISAEMIDKRMDVLTSLQTLPGGFEIDFSRTIPAGVGFHHAGLTVEEREIVAEAYDTGVLKVMVATCSLAAGINLPARRVILNGARMGRNLVGPAMLRQMRGRAGRKGKDEIGETFLCCRKSELETVAELLEAELPPVASSLTSEKRGIKRAVLEVVATRLGFSYESLKDFIRCSLLWQTTPHTTVLKMLDEALENLLEYAMIEKVPDHDGVYVPTRLGSAVVASSLNPDDGLFVHSDLRRAMSSFVMDSELHILYLFTPIPQHNASSSLTSDISWPIFRGILDALDEPSLRALQLVGINPARVNRMANSGLSDLKESTPDEIRTARIYRRAYSTFALRDLCNEVTVHEIGLKYELARGTIQNLAQSCHGFAAGMIKFCQRMAAPVPANPFQSGTVPTSASLISDAHSAGFSMLSTILEHMVDRLRASARSDLLEMAQVTFVKGRMARLLYENGFKGVRALSEADPKSDILPIMMMVQGWKTKTNMPQPHLGEDGDRDESLRLHEQEQEIRRQRLEEKLLRKAEILVASAGRVWERECMKAVMEEE